MVSDEMKARYDREQIQRASMRNNWFYSTTLSERKDYLPSYKLTGMDHIK